MCVAGVVDVCVCALEMFIGSVSLLSQMLAAFNHQEEQRRINTSSGRDDPMVDDPVVVTIQWS